MRPEQAAVALAEVEDRRKQGAKEVARTVWTWPAGAMVFLLLGVATQFVDIIAFPLILLVVVGVVLWSKRSKDRGLGKQNNAVLPRSARYLIFAAMGVLILLFIGLKDIPDWRYASIIAGAVTAALQTLTGPFVRRVIAAAIVRSWS